MPIVSAETAMRCAQAISSCVRDVLCRPSGEPLELEPCERRSRAELYFASPAVVVVAGTGDGASSFANSS